MLKTIQQLCKDINTEQQAGGPNWTEDNLLLTLKAIAAAPKRPDNDQLTPHFIPDISDSLHKRISELIAELHEEMLSDILNRSASPKRLSDLRSAMKKQGIDVFLIPLADEFHGEATSLAAERLKWLTGFTGSAGFAAVSTDTAAIFVDGRYTLQVRNEVDTTLFTPRHVSDEPLSDWLADTLTKESTLAIDPWLHTEAAVTSLKTTTKKAGAELVSVSTNPIDQIWDKRPPLSLALVRPHPDTLSGQSSKDKRAQIATQMKEATVDATLHNLPDVVCWLLNVRGADLPCTPFALSQAILYADGTVDWFIDPRKLSEGVLSSLSDDVTVRSPNELSERIGLLKGKRVQLDPTCASQWFIDQLKTAGAQIVHKEDPCLLPKATKNEIEVDGMRKAHVRDGVAMAKFLHWLGTAAQDGQRNELEAEDILYSFRTEGEYFQDISFNTISGAGSNGAIVHYRATEESCKTLDKGNLYLVDSGGQYLDGTTDITRTVAIGEPTEEMKHRFTLVLKGHISLARVVFPKGTTGSQLDTLARQHLWKEGLDYDHGTGHGVGSYLSVHEGPHRVSKMPSTVPLAKGMVLSNEPGYYKTGEYGIRIENLVTVVDHQAPTGAEREILAFENLTFAPIDRRLIEPSILNSDEIHWINSYHAEVREKISPLLSGEVKEWLIEVTEPL